MQAIPDADLLERTLLRDGTVVLLRLIRSDDRERLHRGFHRLSPDTRYRRFLSIKNDLSPVELGYLCEVDQRQHVALVALSEDGERCLGVARFVVLAGEPTVAEAAMTVADELQGRGLGSLLFDRLVALARARGVASLRGLALASNHGIIRLVMTRANDAVASFEAGLIQLELSVASLS